MAHHQDDQAETVLLQLLRGAGLEGISGMPESAPLGAGVLLRPFLRIESHHILNYAQQHGLCWIDDQSNQDTRFDRNYLRHTIIPKIKERWPATSRVLSRTARHAADAAEQQRKQQQALAEKIAPEGHFDLSAAEHLDPSALRLAIRGWFSHHSLRMPSERMIISIIEELFRSGTDRTPMILLPDGSRLHRYRNVAYRIPFFEQPSPCTWSDWRKPLILPGGNGTMAFNCEMESMDSYWDSSVIQIRYRQGGEKIQLEGRRGHHALKDLFQEHRLPHWVRSHIPLLYLGGMLASVGGFWLNSEIFTHAQWHSVPRPRWRPPEGIDPTGALEALQSTRI